MCVKIPITIRLLLYVTQVIHHAASGTSITLKAIIGRLEFFNKWVI